MTKAGLRVMARERLRAYGGAARSAEEEALRAAFLASEECAAAQCIGLYMPLGYEVDTRPLVPALRALGKRVGVPVLRDAGAMVFGEYVPDMPLTRTALGVMEPQQVREVVPEVLVVPGLLFTRSGARLGQGGGYYDRYLADFAGVTVALALGCQMVDELPVEVHDVVMGRVITA